MMHYEFSARSTSFKLMWCIKWTKEWVCSRMRERERREREKREKRERGVEEHFAPAANARSQQIQT